MRYSLILYNLGIFLLHIGKEIAYGHCLSLGNNVCIHSVGNS